MGRAFLLSPFWPLLPSLSQDTDTEATAMVVDMVMEVMAMEDTEVTMARDPLRLMLSQDTMAMEDMVLDMDMAVMVLVIEDTDTEVTMARDLLMLRLMLSQDTTDIGYGLGYGYGGYGLRYGGYRGYYGKRSADAEPGYYGYRSYGYGGYRGYGGYGYGGRYYG